MQETQDKSKSDRLELWTLIAVRLAFRVTAFAVLLLFYSLFEQVLHHQKADITIFQVAGGLTGATIGDILWMVWLQNLNARKIMALFLFGLASVVLINIWANKLIANLPESARQDPGLSSTWLVLLLTAIFAANIFADIFWNQGLRAVLMPQIRAFFKKN